jgi:hypothetical protein
VKNLQETLNSHLQEQRVRPARIMESDCHCNGPVRRERALSMRSSAGPQQTEHSRCSLCGLCPDMHWSSACHLSMAGA